MADLKELALYPYSGHIALMANLVRDWQSVDYVLHLFDAWALRTRHAYEKYVEDDFSAEGKCCCQKR